MTPEEASSMHYAGEPIEFAIPDGVEGPVYCVGDSHVNVLQNAFPDMFAQSHWSFDDSETVFHSKTAYAVGSDKDGNFIEKAYRSIPEGSKVLMSFGEIDCRHYLPRFAKERGVSLDVLVDEVIKRYKLQCLNAFQKKYRLMVMSAYVTPNDRNHCMSQEHVSWRNPYEEILKAKFLLNEKLEQYCRENDVLFVPIFAVSQEEEWEMHPIGTYFGDDSHASGCMVPVILNAMAGFKWKGFDV